MTGLLVLLISLPASAQDRHVLKVRAQEGDRFTHYQEQKNDVSMTTILGNNRKTQTLVNREVLAYEDEVLKTEREEPVRVRRNVLQWWKESREAKQAEGQKVPFTLQGRTIVLHRKGAETAYEGAEGIPIDELARHRIRQEPFLNSLPPGPVPVGQEWKVDEARFRRELEGAAAGGAMRFRTVTARGRFVRVRERKGERCAVIEVTVVADGAFARAKGLKAQYRLTTVILLGLETGRPHTMDGRGSIQVNGDVEQDGQPIRLEGAFTITMKGRNDFK